MISMMNCRSVHFWIAAAVVVASPLPATAEPSVLDNGGFESGLASPWGSGQNFQQRDIWWNSKGCRSSASIDEAHRFGGARSLHIVNDSPRAPHVFGTTQQPCGLRANVRYRLSVWARGQDLASAGAVSIVVDDRWTVRPVQLPAGTYDWTLFTGEFSLADGGGQVRILSEDRGEAWLDDITLAPVGDGPADSFVADAQRVERLAKAATAFSRVAQDDYRTAVQTNGSDAVRAKFDSLDAEVWTDTDPQHGWSYFFSTALITTADPRGTQALVAYYHPWSDVCLVTLWEHHEQNVRLIDAELLLGDLLRNRGEFVDGPFAKWIQETEYKPAALGMTTADTVRAFEDAFREVPAGQWRRSLAKLDDPRILSGVNYCGASLRLLDALDRIGRWHLPSDDEHRSLEHLREQTSETMRGLAGGQVDSVLVEAPRTLPAVAQALRKWPADAFRKFVVVSTMLGDESSLIFLLPPGGEDYCLCLLFTGRPGEQRLVRIDLISFDGFYASRHAQSKK